MKKDKLVTIDFWNTIYDSSEGNARNKFRLKALVEEIDLLGMYVSGEQFTAVQADSWEFFNRLWKEQMHTPSPRETVQFFWDRLGLPENEHSIDRVTKAFSESVLHFPPSLLDGIENVLPALSEKYDLAIISDTGFSPGMILRELLEKGNILKYFSAFSFSDETGVAKPHPKAFHTVLDELNISPANALHIGDIENTDINGAKSIGMKAIRFSGDKTARFTEDNPKVSIADAEVFSWNEMPVIIDSLLNQD